MNEGEFKRKLLSTGLFRKTSGSQYVCKTCPYCGDTKSHMYVLIKQEDDTPVLYHCFKCNASGILNQEFLEYFDINDIEIPRFKGRRRIQPNGNHNTVIDLIDYEKDTGMVEMSSMYIQERIGIRPNKNELKMFQIIGNPYSYIETYLGGDMKGVKDRVWFRLSNGNMIGRSVDADSNFRWKKRNCIDGSNGSGIYIIKNNVDTYQTINVCICEGVMDAIGLYYHSGLNNAVFIACMGRDYSLGIKYVINAGIFGLSVNVRIYKDSDVDYVKLNKKYGYLFKSISVYKNAIGKDYGVHADKIEFEKCQ